MPEGHQPPSQDITVHRVAEQGPSAETSVVVPEGERLPTLADMQNEVREKDYSTVAAILPDKTRLNLYALSGEEGGDPDEAARAMLAHYQIGMEKAVEKPRAALDELDRKAFETLLEGAGHWEKELESRRRQRQSHRQQAVAQPTTSPKSLRESRPGEDGYL